MAIWEDLFQVFLFGDGAWLGLVCIMAIVILVTYKVKLSGILFTIVCVFLGIQYLNNIAVNSNFMWCAIIIFLTGLFCLLISMYDIKG